MKTAISLPDRVFESAEEAARRLGLSRSRLYVAALVSFLEKHQDSKVTETLNRIYGETASGLDAGIESVQTRTLRKERW